MRGYVEYQLMRPLHMLAALAALLAAAPAKPRAMGAGLKAVPGKQGLSKISYEYQVYPLWLLQEPRNMAPVNIDIVDG